MEHIIKNTTELLISLDKLRDKLYNKEYWFNKVKEETDLILSDDAWIYVEVTFYKISVSVHSSKGVNYKSKHWINGEWFNSSFDTNYPDLKALL